MSGTSADGIDAALVRITEEEGRPRAELVEFATVPYPDELRDRLFAAFADRVTTRDLCLLNALVGELFAAAAQAVAAAAGVPLAVNRVGSMLTPFFVKQQGQPVRNFADATACDTAAYATFFHSMLEQGIHLAPSQYEAMFVGLAHKNDLIDKTVDAAAVAFKAVARSKRAA